MSTLEAPEGGDINRGTQLLIIAVVFATLSTITTTVRINVRMLKHQFGYDDFAISLATVLVLIELVFNGLEYHDGGGRHAFYLSEQQQRNSLKWIYVTQYLMFLVLCITKIGLCLFILRIKDSGWLRWCLYGLMGGLILTTLPVIIIASAQCRPLSAFWDRTAGTCWNIDVYNNAVWVQIGYSIFSDLVCSLLPLVVLWNVKVSKNLKIAVCGLMSVGLLATGCAAARASTLSNNESEDLTWALNIISIWGGLEENFAIIGANLAMSRAVYVYVRDVRQSSRGKSRYQQPSYLSDRQLQAPLGWQRNIHACSKSEDSVIPLETFAIKKTFNLSLVRESRSELGRATSDLELNGRTHLAVDQV